MGIIIVPTSKGVWSIKIKLNIYTVPDKSTHLVYDRY